MSAVVGRLTVIVRNLGPGSATQLRAVELSGAAGAARRELGRLPSLEPGEHWTVELPASSKADQWILVDWWDGKGAQQLVLPGRRSGPSTKDPLDQIKRLRRESSHRGDVVAPVAVARR